MRCKLAGKEKKNRQSRQPEFAKERIAPMVPVRSFFESVGNRLDRCG